MTIAGNLTSVPTDPREKPGDCQQPAIKRDQNRGKVGEICRIDEAPGFGGPVLQGLIDRPLQHITPGFIAAT